MRRNYIIKYFKPFLIILLACFIFSCDGQNLSTTFDNINDPGNEQYRPDVPDNLKIESISETGATFSWYYDYSLSETDAFSSGELSFQLELGDENKSSFVPVDFTDGPTKIYSGLNRLLINGTIKNSFALDKTFCLRIRSVRNNKYSDYSDTLYGKTFLGTAQNFATYYNLNGSDGKLWFTWTDEVAKTNNTSLKEWNCLLGSKIFYREVKSPEESFKEIADTPKSNDHYYFCGISILANLVKGRTYEFAIMTYSETHQSSLVTKTLTYK